MTAAMEDTPAATETEQGSAKRKRVTRACDTCNTLRTKCDGGQPCRHCLDTNTTCEFNRIRRKRGKAARRDTDDPDVDDALAGISPAIHRLDDMDKGNLRLPALQVERSNHALRNPSFQQEWLPTAASPSYRQYGHQAVLGAPEYDTHTTSAAFHSHFYNGNPRNSHEPAPPLQSQASVPTIPAHYFLPAPAPSPRSGNMSNSDTPYSQNMFGTSTGIGSPRSLTSPSTFHNSNHSRFDIPNLRYPILSSLRGELDFLPTQVLCDLLDTYFENSPHVLGYVVQKHSILHQSRPRRTSTALIYAMLCVAAHTCEHSFLASTPLVRARTVQRLFEMSVTALRPLQHDEVGGGGLDDVITYMQLGTIIAASEFKSVSLRWLHAAWTLAKELRLNQEVSDKDTPTTELDKEERRRTWWLLYIMDRHLSLCYNKPLVLTDVECSKLYHPMKESIWTSEQDLDLILEVDPRRDSARSMNSSDAFLQSLYENRAMGPSFEVQGSGIFGFFLPLMTILGEICVIFGLKNHYHLVPFGDLNGPKSTIRGHLHRYEQSLLHWAGRDRPDHRETHVFALYATQLMHTMHVLLCSKWDPVDMLEDSDNWISSDEFLQATTHAVNAAEAVRSILLSDPDLAYMPFFFGIYLLQGSFLLLLIVDKLEQDADAAVIQACEAYVRAHEVCVVTLETQYQRNFRTVMRKTLNSVRQHVRSTEEEKSKRRELLNLYRWAGEGRGLAI